MRLELYYTYIDPTDTALVARLWDRLPPTRQQQLATRNLAARAEGVALSALLAFAAAAWQTGQGTAFQSVAAASLPPPFAEWKTNALGKPFAEGIATEHGRLFASFSHSDGHVLVALCDRPLGADIQVWQAAAFSPDRFRRTAARIAHPDETPPTTPRETARRFAAKEAALKLGGEGLRCPPASVAVTEATAGRASLFFYEQVPHCIIAVAVSR